jgi:hypothetical protein
MDSQNQHFFCEQMEVSVLASGVISPCNLSFPVRSPSPEIIEHMDVAPLSVLSTVNSHSFVPLSVCSQPPLAASQLATINSRAFISSQPPSAFTQSLSVPLPLCSQLPSMCSQLSTVNSQTFISSQPPSAPQLSTINSQSFATPPVCSQPVTVNARTVETSPLQDSLNAVSRMTNEVDILAHGTILSSPRDAQLSSRNAQSSLSRNSSNQRLQLSIVPTIERRRASKQRYDKTRFRVSIHKDYIPNFDRVSSSLLYLYFSNINLKIGSGQIN